MLVWTNAANIGSYRILNEKVHVKRSMRFRLLQQHTFFKGKKISRKLFYENEFCVNVDPSADRHRCGAVCTARKCRQLRPIRKNHATAIQPNALCVRAFFVVDVRQVVRSYTTKYILGKNDTFFNITLSAIIFFHFTNSMPHNFFAAAL